jgi:putative ABC transport system permease protein
VNFFEIMRFAVRGLTANKLRSALTTLGITIGVAAVILLVAVGNGASASIAASIQGLGTNVRNVSPAGVAVRARSPARSPRRTRTRWWTRWARPT